MDGQVAFPLLSLLVEGQNITLLVCSTILHVQSDSHIRPLFSTFDQVPCVELSCPLTIQLCFPVCEEKKITIETT